MASEMRRMAKALVDSRSESYRSRYPLAESQARLAAGLARIERRRTRLQQTWREDTGVVLDAHFSATPGTQRLLKATSIVLAALVGAGAWGLMAADDDPFRYIAPLAAALGMLAFPLVVMALGSQREAEEARIRKAIGRALTDEAEPGGDRSR